MQGVRAHTDLGALCFVPQGLWLDIDQAHPEHQSVKWFVASCDVMMWEIMRAAWLADG